MGGALAQRDRKKAAVKEKTCKERRAAFVLVSKSLALDQENKSPFAFTFPTSLGRSIFDHSLSGVPLCMLFSLVSHFNQEKLAVDFFGRRLLHKTHSLHYLSVFRYCKRVLVWGLFCLSHLFAPCVSSWLFYTEDFWWGVAFRLATHGWQEPGCIWHAPKANTNVLQWSKRNWRRGNY